MNEVRGDTGAERFAGLVFANREAILNHWYDLARIEEAGQAAEFIRSQLDASIIALANWFLGVDPVESTMSVQWASAPTSRDFTVGAIVSMNLLPEAVRLGLSEVDQTEVAACVRHVSEFSALLTRRLVLTSIESEDEGQWDQFASQIDAHYEALRIQRVRRLSVLIDIAHAVSTSEDLDTLFEHVQQSVIRISGSDYIEISLLERESAKLRCHLVFGNGNRQTHLEQTLIESGLANEVLTSGESLVVSDYVQACRDRCIEPSTALTPAVQRSWMAAPMRRGDDIIGVIAISGQLTTYDSDDVDLLTAIARQTAVALENRRLIEAQRRHLAHLRAVNRLGQQTAHLRNADDLMETTATHIHDLFDYDLVTVFRASRDGKYLWMAARTPIPVSDEHEALVVPVNDKTVVGSVALEREARRHRDVTTLDAYMATSSTMLSRSEMAVPVIHSGVLLGVLDVQSEQINAFDRHDLTTLQTIADQLAVGLENSRLFSEEAQRSHDLKLMLETTRAAGSSLVIDQVLERLAEGLATAAGATECLIHLYNPDDSCFIPSAAFQRDPQHPGCLITDWNRIISADQFPDLVDALKDPFPQLVCLIPAGTRSGPTPATYVIPLRTRQRTLGLAIVACTAPEESRCPIEQMRLLQGVADSTALAVENARLYARAHGLAIAEERGRLAQEIHDTLAQGLTAISLQLDLADSYLPDSPEKAARNVQRALELTRENLNQARRSVLDLRAADVHQMSLPDAISQLIRRLSDDSSAVFEFINEGLTSRLSARVEVGLYRIIEEALENARRHSGAESVRVFIRADGSTVTATIEDDGTGFNLDETPAQDHPEPGFGLLGIRERARLLGGTLAVTSAPDLGTTLRVTVPYEARMKSSVANSAETGVEQ
jgi:signal transduction histidine kinase/putative methionine-R-sulfoxide reductase with GAF domain